MCLSAFILAWTTPPIHCGDSHMAKETAQLAEYAASLRYADIPGDVVKRAKQCIADTIATIIFGYDLSWSRIVVAFAQRYGTGGKSRILGLAGAHVHPPAAALANGALAHAFEMDNLTWPSTGVHPGATLLASGLAVAQERGIGGRELIAAFVAGAEVMIRIGRATHHSNEGRGFHAPGTTGPFGAAIACGKLMDFDAERMCNALGIAGSLSCGLMEFARSGTGAMVKRLHLGRGRERRTGGEPRGRRLHRPGQRARRRVRLPARLLRQRVRRRRAHARARGELRDPLDHAQALPLPHHRAHPGAGDPRPARRAPLRRRGRRLDPHRRQ